MLSAALLQLALLLCSVSAVNVLDPSTDLDTLGNNTLFTKWRPSFHVTAPAGWLNDPCGAVYDPKRDEYHIMYQWHNNHVQWGNISWGHAVSKDLVQWTDVTDWRDDKASAIATSEPYDHLGIFTGTVQPIDLKGNNNSGSLLALYTSVKFLPTNWQIPYTPGTETQSLAISNDGGRTWQKYANNPVIAGPPTGWNITGFRDPFYQLWPEMDTILKTTEPHYYMVMGSGIKGVGPRMPFFSAPANDLTKWTFLGALWEPEGGSTFGDVLTTGNYGFNFEVSNFFSLKDSKGESHFFTSMGAEGGGGIPNHDRWALWTEGSVSRRDNGSAAYKVLSSGVADYGNLYAITAFHDTKKDRRVQWGWSDEDMNQFGVKAQGFQGSLSLPRELFVLDIDNVVSTELVPFPIKSNFRTSPHGAEQPFTATTLGVRPLPDVVAALQKSAQKHVPMKSGEHLSSNDTRWLTSAGKPITSSRFSIAATLTNTREPSGFVVLSSATSGEQTTVVYDPNANTITVDRSKSSLITQFGNFSVVGEFVALPIQNPTTGNVAREPLQLTVFVDGSLVEVFANDRFTLTTRAYPTHTGSGEGRIGVFGKNTVFSDVVVHSDIKTVWPDRPSNTSSKLVFDPPAESNNGLWWAGW